MAAGTKRALNSMLLYGSRSSTLSCDFTPLFHHRIGIGHTGPCYSTVMNSILRSNVL
uniref:Uncharacterized protein n=1 Tax=Arundo donax TaxID=35708 RepID=A0A0A9CXJ8_ARUDO